MKFKNSALTLLVLFLSFQSFGKDNSTKAFKFHPKLTVFESYTFIKDYSKIQNGFFAVENSPFNFGFDISQKVYLVPEVFFQFGLRYQSFKKNVYAENQIEELPNFPYPMYWENSYTAIMIPMHFGKDYYINNQQRGDWYFGLSLGLLMHSYAKSGVGITNLVNDDVEISILNYGDSETNPNFFLPLAELGFSFIPLKDFDKLSIGLSLEAQLNKTSYTRHLGVMEATYPSQVDRYVYDMSNSSRIFNVSGRLSYRF